MRVSLKCGERNEIVRIHEPNKCMYTGEIRTPAACTEKELLLIESELESEAAALFGADQNIVQ